MRQNNDEEEEMKNDDEFFKNLEKRLRNLAAYTLYLERIDENYVLDVTNVLKESMYAIIRDIDVFLNLFIKSEFTKKDYD
jgi:hypothetical protein